MILDTFLNQKIEVSQHIEIMHSLVLIHVFFIESFRQCATLNFQFYINAVNKLILICKIYLLPL